MKKSFKKFLKIYILFHHCQVHIAELWIISAGDKHYKGGQKPSMSEHSAVEIPSRLWKFFTN